MSATFPAGAQAGTSSTDRQATPRARLLLVLGVALALALAGCASPDEEAAETDEAEVAFEMGDDRTQHTVSYDPDDRPTMNLYDDAEAQRPDAFTVHDLLAQVDEETDTAIETRHDPDLGYELVAVDGTEPGQGERWTLYVDGERETAGISTVTVDESSTYEWRLEDTTTSGTDSGDTRSDDTDERDTSDEPSSGDETTDEDQDQGTEDTSSDDGETQTRQATFAVDYNGFRDQEPQRTEHTVSYDPDARPTMHRYENGGPDRPDAYILHDLVSDWANQTDTDHLVREDEDTGYVLQSIDGVTAHSTRGGSWTWTLTVDGEAETAGISTIQVEAGSTYEWTFERTNREG